jgi:hypothetical protein
MGKINQGVLGGVSGKIGNVIGSTWKGIDYLRIMPVSVADPQTVPQLTQRLKFATVEAFIQPSSQFLRIGFKAYAVKMSGFNAALSYNIKNAITGTYPNYDIDPAVALLSRGVLEAPNTPSAAAAASEAVVFSWLNPAGAGNASDTDITYCIVLNVTKNQMVYFGNTSTRADLTQTVTVPASWDGDGVLCYLMFMSASTGIVSNSGYAGTVTILA